MAAEINLKEQIARIPHKPGVYQFFDSDGAILYIGKARDLKKRATTYLRGADPERPQIPQMMTLARSIEITVTQNELEALLLEATLIRKHLPPYNVFLKDDKRYAFLRVTMRDQFPMIQKARHISYDGSKYFGPYVSASSVNDLLRVAKTFFPYPSCTVSHDDPCLIVKHGEQVGPLQGTLGNPEKYRHAIHELTLFLSGKRNIVIEQLQERMRVAAGQRHFEQAARLRDRIQSIERLHQQQDVVSTRRDNVDVVNLATRKGCTAACLFRIRGGRLVHTHRAILVHASELDSHHQPELLRTFLEQYYTQTSDFPHEILVPQLLTKTYALMQLVHAEIRIPRRGKRRRLLQLCQENAEDFLRSQRARFEQEQEFSNNLLEEFSRRLGLFNIPTRIEVYDISNIQGRFPVGSMIVFENGKPKKSEYRKFTIRDQTTPDDFRAMHQMLSRRLSHDTWPAPDLLIIDGGKGQLSAVMRAMQETKKSYPIIALAKRLEEVFFPDRPESVRLPEDSESFLFLQRMRDEAHRFAIGFYRIRHRKASTRSALDDVPGIGPKTKQRLLKTFGSVPEIRRASDQELLRVVGPSMLRAIRQYL